MRIVYQIPSIETVYAARFIYEGYKNAFEELGHQIIPFTGQDSLQKILCDYNPDIFITSLNSYNFRYLDLNLMKDQRKTKGMVLFTQIRPWTCQCKQYGAGGLKDFPEDFSLIKKGLAGDVFFHWLEEDDPFMDGFEKETGYTYYKILLAADTKRFYYEYDSAYAGDICFIGNYLPDKRDFFKAHLFPLLKKYKVNIYGNDWTWGSQVVGYFQKLGQYFDISSLKRIRKIVLPLEDERKVYASSGISLNIHEKHQRKYGSDFNERTFKIIASGGFELCDNVKVLRRYFTEDELVIAENTTDWFEKIRYYFVNPDKRASIIEAGRKVVLSSHTYVNRAEQFIELYRNHH